MSGSGTFHKQTIFYFYCFNFFMMFLKRLNYFSSSLLLHSFRATFFDCQDSLYEVFPVSCHLNPIATIPNHIL